jgi:hypothetical protein
MGFILVLVTIKENIIKGIQSLIELTMDCFYVAWIGYACLIVVYTVYGLICVYANRRTGDDPTPTLPPLYHTEQAPAHAEQAPAYPEYLKIGEVMSHLNFPLSNPKLWNSDPETVFEPDAEEKLRADYGRAISGTIKSNVSMFGNVDLRYIKGRKKELASVFAQIVNGKEFEELHILDLASGIGYTSLTLGSMCNVASITMHDVCDYGNEAIELAQKIGVSVPLKFHVSDLLKRPLIDIVDTVPDDGKPVVITMVHACGNVWHTILEQLNDDRIRINLKRKVLILCLPCCYAKNRTDNTIRSLRYPGKVMPFSKNAVSDIKEPIMSVRERSNDKHSHIKRIKMMLIYFMTNVCSTPTYVFRNSFIVKVLKNTDNSCLKDVLVNILVQTPTETVPMTRLDMCLERLRGLNDQDIQEIRVAGSNMFRTHEVHREKLEMIAFSRAELLILTDILEFTRHSGYRADLYKLLGCDTARDHCFVISNF